MPTWQELVALILAWLIIAGAGAFVVLILRTLSAPAESIPQRRRFIAWNGPFVSIAFLVFLTTPGYVKYYIAKPVLSHALAGVSLDEKTENDLALCAADLLALPIQLALWVGLDWIAGGRWPARARPRHTLAGLRLAFVTWLALTPLVYVVSFIALMAYAWIMGRPPDEHPIIQTLQRGPVPVRVAVIFLAQAVLSAPIKEEVFFRGILQPWLATKPWGGDLALWLAAIVGVMAHTPAGLQVSSAVPILFVLVVLPAYRWLDRWDLSRWLPVRDPVARRQAVRAIFGTSLLFANFHANVWPTPVPLFVLSLGLGWLAYRTQGVVAPIVVHMLFNAIVFASLAIRAILPLTPGG